MNIEMLEFGTTNDNISCWGKIDQPQFIIVRHIMKAEFTDCLTKYSFLAQLGVEVNKHDFNIMINRSDPRAHKRIKGRVLVFKYFARMRIVANRSFTALNCKTSLRRRSPITKPHPKIRFSA